MQIIRGSRHLKEYNLVNPVVTLGNFDGVHRGHQKILKKAIQRAQVIGGVAAVYTFSPHPLNVLRPKEEPPKITTFEEKAAYIEDLGIDYLICEHFTKRFAGKTAEEFLQEVICKRIRPKEIIIGHDYSFGKKRSGDIALLQQFGLAHNYRVHVVSDIRIKNIPVRSTTIRKLILEGRVSLAAKLLGKNYSISGMVVHGRQRRIGFPTANLSHINDLVPQNGIYAIRVDTPRGTYNGVVNIGFVPTFDAHRRTIEAHIFGFDQDIYGEQIRIHFVKRIRSEKKFKDVKKLIDQIQKDIAFAKRILK
ncbi:bifunctional riboflavin kinase/FAD synthetase [Thermodesulfobacteriota bacterium]